MTEYYLFRSTVRRTYADNPSFKHYAGLVQESTHFEWATNPRWGIEGLPFTRYEGRTYKDEVIRLELMPEETIGFERGRVLRSTYARYRCCDLAIFRPCVCLVSFSCPEHGTRCHGTHD